MITNQIDPTSHKDRVDGRLIWVDLAKSFGLFLVFWGHTLYGGSHFSDVLNRAIYSFHMPMFFILSGYVTKPDNNSFRQYVKKKFKRIVLPALILYVLALPLFLLLFVDTSNITFYSFITRFLYLHGECLGNKPVWFFFCLFQVLALIKVLDLPNAKLKSLILCCVACFVLSYLLYASGYRCFKWFGFDKCVLGFCFYVFGMILKKTNYNILRVGILLLPIWITAGIVLNTKVRMYDMYLGNYWLFILSGITGSLFFFALCKLVESLRNNSTVRFIVKYAKWTVFIVSSHYILTFLFRALLGKLSLLHTYTYDITSFCFVVIALLLYYPLCRWIEKHAPILI